MYNEKIESLISAALADGELTEKEKQILFKRAEAEGIDLDEFEMVLDARLVELEKEQKSSAPKSNKMGEIKKCPACGAIVNSFSGVCGECGYTFEEIQANLTSVKLYNRLQKAKSEDEKENIIRSFPIPMTKADLLEFISRFRSEVYDSDGTFTLTDSAYYTKYSECIEKCKMSFRKDSQISYYINEYENAQKKGQRKMNSDIIVTVCMVVGIICGCIWAYVTDAGFWGWCGAFFGGDIAGLMLGNIIGEIYYKVSTKEK